MWRSACLAGVLACGPVGPLSTPALTDHPLTIRVSPALLLWSRGTPPTVSVQVITAAHPENRWLIVALLDEAGEIQRSTREMAGADAPVVWPPFLFRLLGPGQYTIVAAVIRRDGARITAREGVEAY